MCLNQTINDIKDKMMSLAQDLSLIEDGKIGRTDGVSWGWEEDPTVYRDAGVGETGGLV